MVPAGSPHVHSECDEIDYFTAIWLHNRRDRQHHTSGALLPTPNMTCGENDIVQFLKRNDVSTTNTRNAVRCVPITTDHRKKEILPPSAWQGTLQKRWYLTSYCNANRVLKSHNIFNCKPLSRRCNKEYQHPSIRTLQRMLKCPHFSLTQDLNNNIQFGLLLEGTSG